MFAYTKTMTSIFVLTFFYSLAIFMSFPMALFPVCESFFRSSMAKSWLGEEVLKANTV